MHRGSEVQAIPILLRFFIPEITPPIFTLVRAAMIPLRRGQSPPLYQEDAISWLQRFRNTELLQQMLSRFHFPESEIAAYRSSWAAWLKPKKVLFVQRRGNR